MRSCGRLDLLILVALLARPGTVLARGDLLQAAWGDDPDGGPDSAAKCISYYLQRLDRLAPDLGFSLECEGYRGVFASILPRELAGAAR